MKKCDVSDMVADLLLDASDYIGNDPEKFDADNATLDTIKNNEKFREMVKEDVEMCPEEYEGLNQKEAAEAVWQIYLSWLHR